MKINPFSRFMLGMIFIWVVIIPNLRAQTTPAKPQLFYIHEDPVTPAMVNEYEKVSKELISQCKKHGIQDGWLTIQDDDHKYYTIVPVANMADLDKDPLEPDRICLPQVSVLLLRTQKPEQNGGSFQTVQRIVCQQKGESVL